MGLTPASEGRPWARPLAGGQAGESSLRATLACQDKVPASRRAGLQDSEADREATLGTAGLRQRHPPVHPSLPAHAGLLSPATRWLLAQREQESEEATSTTARALQTLGAEPEPGRPRALPGHRTAAPLTAAAGTSPARPSPSCVAWGKWVPFSEPQLRGHICPPHPARHPHPQP